MTHASHLAVHQPSLRNRRRLVDLLVLAALAVAAGSLPLPALAADSEPLDLDPELQALVAREKIKQRGATRRTDARRGLQTTGTGAGSDSNCGSVDIGNSNNESRSARNRVNPRDTTVIVTGPVINAARCK